MESMRPNRLSSRIKKLKQRVKGDSGGNETVDSLRDEISGLQKDIADMGGNCERAGDFEFGGGCKNRHAHARCDAT